MKNLPLFRIASDESWAGPGNEARHTKCFGNLLVYRTGLC